VKATFKITLLSAAAVAIATAVQAQPAKSPALKAQPAKPVPARSVFIIPTNPREGRDPFFPESTRLFDEMAVQTNAPTASAKTLVVRGSSWENGHAMLIINNHTFAVGEQGDVLTPGGRVHLRLVEIRKDVAIVEVNGTQRELSLTAK
jgi:hypothetical protein